MNTEIEFYPHDEDPHYFMASSLQRVLGYIPICSEAHQCGQDQGRTPAEASQYVLILQDWSILHTLVEGGGETWHPASPGSLEGAGGCTVPWHRGGI